MCTTMNVAHSVLIFFSNVANEECTWPSPQILNKLPFVLRSVRIVQEMMNSRCKLKKVEITYKADAQDVK